MTAVTDQDHTEHPEHSDTSERPERPARPDTPGAWDDGLIARRMNGTAGGPAGSTPREEQPAVAEPRASTPQKVVPLSYDPRLASRLDALRELVGLSRARLDNRTLSQAGRVLDEAAARRRLSGQHTVVAIAGATGSGKSQLFNTLAGVPISETGVRRPTTAAPIACSWSDGAASLIERLGIPPRLRRRPLQAMTDADERLRGLVLVDLPDHDSAAVEHREQVDRVLGLVDAVIWVVDPEKYADAMLHERYLRPMAAHAEVMFVVLNQIDRLPRGRAARVDVGGHRRGVRRARPRPRHDRLPPHAAPGDEPRAGPRGTGAGWCGDRAGPPGARLGDGPGTVTAGRRDGRGRDRRSRRRRDPTAARSSHGDVKSAAAVPVPVAVRTEAYRRMHGEQSRVDLSISPVQRCPGDNDSDSDHRCDAITGKRCPTAP
ncbi:hypothetical protein STENM223S_06405 [Streptomyces tendae]